MSGFTNTDESDSGSDDSETVEPEHMSDSDESVERSVEDIVENMQLTDKHKSFLRCIHDYGGEASISKIKKKTGLSQSEADSRFKKWSNEEFNLIDVKKLSSEETGKPNGERLAVLNERGETAIQQGFIGDVFDEGEKEVRRVFGEGDIEDFEELQEEVERLGNVVDRLQSEVDNQEEDNEGVREKVDSFEDDIIQLSDKVGNLEERVERAESGQGLDELDGVKGRVSQLESRVDTVEEDVSGLRESFEEFRAGVREHLENAQAYMKGIRWALEDESEEELSIGEYIKKVKDS